jgi:DNA-binding MarR family transcriptional regulator
MSRNDDLGWRARAVALAALGAAGLSRAAFAHQAPGDPPPLQMQALVLLALQDSTGADPARHPGSGWLRSALALDGGVIDQIADALVRDGLATRGIDALDEIEYELGEDDQEAIAELVPLELTDRGWEAVDRWFSRTAHLFRGWPPESSAAGDAV